MAAIPVAVNLRAVENMTPVENMTYQTYLTDPAAREQIDAAARSARTQAMRRYLLMPLVRFCGKLMSVPALGPQHDPRVPQ